MAAQGLASTVGVAPACEALGVSRATFYRRQRPVSEHQQPRPTPARALCEAEREHVLDVLASTRFDSSAYYSPDGTQITFTSDRTGTTGIWLSDADGSNLEPVFLHPGVFSGSGRFSPDGRHLAFDSYPDDNGDIFVISASGGEPFRLTTHPTDDQVPSWSGDGKWVYFGSARTGRFEIWRAPAAYSD